MSREELLLNLILDSPITIKDFIKKYGDRLRMINKMLQHAEAVAWTQFEGKNEILSTEIEELSIRRGNLYIRIKLPDFESGDETVEWFKEAGYKARVDGSTDKPHVIVELKQSDKIWISKYME